VHVGGGEGYHEAQRGHEYSAEEQRELEERLRRLGYMG
jgi:hypothetical protein